MKNVPDFTTDRSKNDLGFLSWDLKVRIDTSDGCQDSMREYQLHLCKRLLPIIVIQTKSEFNDASTSFSEILQYNSSEPQQKDFIQLLDKSSNAMGLCMEYMYLERNVCADFYELLQGHILSFYASPN